MYIKLTNSSKKVIIDDENYEWIIKHNWCLDGAGYAITNKRKGMISSLMHRLIMNAPDYQDVDHINGNTLDNRRKNLRNCSRANNLHNSKKHKDNKSGYKGVYKHSQGKWCALIMCKGKREYLGLFEELKEAVQAYNDAAIRLHGEYAKLNKLPK